MSAFPMIRDRRKHVRDDLLPDLHRHQAQAQADLSFAMTEARHCHSGQLAAIAPGDTTPAATQRRLERTLADVRIDPEAAWPPLARATLRGCSGGPFILMVDEAPNHNDLRCLKLTSASRKRASPIRSACDAPGGQGEPMPERIDRLVSAVAAVLPEGACVTLLADRGLARPQVVDACTRLGGHYVIRLRGQTRVRTADGQERPAAELAPHPGACWRGAAEVFKESGWRAAAVAARWEQDSDGPWLLATDREDGPRVFRRYAERTWTEELFKDEKSSGFHREQSHVTDPAHAGRLVLLIALATYLALSLGSRVIKAGLRRLLGSGRQRARSLFRIGLRFLRFGVNHDRPLPEGLSPLSP